MSQGGSEKASMRKRYLTYDLNDSQNLAGLGQERKTFQATEKGIRERSEQKEAWKTRGIETRAVDCSIEKEWGA